MLSRFTSVSQLSRFLPRFAPISSFSSSSSNSSSSAPAPAVASPSGPAHFAVTHQSDGEIHRAQGGAPVGFSDRVVSIHRSHSNAMQQTGAERRWKLRWEGRENFFITPLMGWHGTSDSQNETYSAIDFQTLELAEEFVKRQGWKYEIEPDHTETPKRKSYAENFKWKGFPKEQKKSN